MEGLTFESNKTPEKIPISMYSFFDRSKRDIVKIPFSCNAEDEQDAYTQYVVWCFTNKIKPLPRSIMSINQISEYIEENEN